MNADTRIRSTLPTDDPEIRDVVREFIDSISVSLDAMTAALEAEATTNWPAAHALKGSAAPRLPCFTEPPAIEQSAKRRNPNNARPLRQIEKLQAIVAV